MPPDRPSAARPDRERATAALAEGRPARRVVGEIVPGRLLVTSAPPPTARINDGDRTISREDAGTVLFVDVVPHEDIGKYGRKPPGA